MIPDEAVEAAVTAAWIEADLPDVVTKDIARKMIEAAAPHLEKAAYERGWGAGFRHHKEQAK